MIIKKTPKNIRSDLRNVAGGGRVPQLPTEQIVFSFQLAAREVVLVMLASSERFS